MYDIETVSSDSSFPTWNVSNVTNMSTMFQYSSSFNRDLSQWEVSNVTDMSTMFSSSFNRDLSLWEVSNVIDMSTTSQPVNENADEDDDELGNSVDTSGWDEMITICPDRTIDEKIMQSVMYTFNGKSVWTGKLLLFRLEYNYATQLYSNWKNLKECPVCFGITTNYQKLDCGHYLCLTCLKHMTNRGDCHYLQKCPMCRAPISKPAYGSRDRRITDMSELITEHFRVMSMMFSGVTSLTNSNRIFSA